MPRERLPEIPLARGRRQPAPLPEDEALRFLGEATITACELIPWGSNYTFAVVLSGNGGPQRLGVYKPQRGEAPLGDFPAGTLYRREVAAYRLASLLGWDFIPATVVRQGPHGIGSLQIYVDVDPTDHFFQFRARYRDELQRIALYDLVANNADRKGGHCLKDRRGKIWGIDHGLTFHCYPKLRTVIWDFCGEPIPDRLLADLERFRSDRARTDRARAELGELLARREVDALFERVDRLIELRRYPELDPYRNVPWPPF